MFELTPKIHAISTVIIFVLIALVLVTQYFTGAIAREAKVVD
jgi:ABC-type spermidine/putrescine transport system permease subunit II